MQKIIVHCYIGNIKPSEAEPTEYAEGFGCHACEYIKDNKIHRCSSFINMDIYNDDGKKIGTEAKCSQSWLAKLLVESTQANRGQTEALESFRNETVKRQDVMIQVAAMSSQDLPLIVEQMPLSEKLLSDKPT